MGHAVTLTEELTSSNPCITVSTRGPAGTASQLCQVKVRPSLGWGKAYRIHVPCQMVYIGVTLGTIGSARYRAYLQFSEADDSNAWKKKGLETDGNRPTLQ